MQTDRGWSWDVPTSAATATLAPRGGEDCDADRRASGESAVHDFVAAAAAASDVDALAEALATAARRVSGDEGASVSLDGGGADFGIPLRAGERGRVWGRLAPGRKGAAGATRPAIVARRLESLATLAALAMERIHREDAAGGPRERERESAIRDAGLLGTVLPFALSQARRHKEPLSILFVAIDRLRGVRDLLGREEADRVVARVGARVAGLLRSSDLVGRLDDDRLVAVLPRSELNDARRVGEKLCQGIAAAEGLMGIPMAASLSIGAASFPASASTLGELLDAADVALDQARALGAGRVAAAPPAGIARP